MADYFPPCNLTPAERILSFAKYFKEFGYYPVIVTRNWDIPIAHPKDERMSTGTRVVHEKNENYEVYYVPYKSTLRDRVFNKFLGTNFYFLYLIIALVYSIGEYFSSHFTSFLPLYKQCRNILKTEKGFSYLLISGSPFHLFKFGYKLNKEFGIKWIADYRDDWSTNNILVKTGIKALGKSFEKRKEIKWVSTATFFISVSDHYVDKITTLLCTVPGYTILNGYIASNYEGLVKSNSNSFSIVYVGALYAGQPIEVFLEGYKAFIDDMPNLITKVTFVGLKTQPQEFKKVQQIMEGYENYVDFTLRMSKNKTIELQNNATLLLLCAHNNLKGVPGSKLYEYVALEKPILACPSDREIAEDTITETGQGYIANSVEECTLQLKKLYKEYGMSNGSAKNINRHAINKYSRYENVKKLALILDHVQNKK